MPLIGLVRLRRALGSATLLFDPISLMARQACRAKLGDRETALGRKWPSDLVMRESRTRPTGGTYRKSVTLAAQDGF